MSTQYVALDVTTNGMTVNPTTDVHVLKFGFSVPIPGAKGDKGDTGNTGAAGPSTNPRGTWVSGTSYAVLDQVVSPVDGAGYQCIVATSGTTDPSADATHWKQVVLRGATPATGSGIAQVTIGSTPTIVGDQTPAQVALAMRSFNIALAKGNAEWFWVGNSLLAGYLVSNHDYRHKPYGALVEAALIARNPFCTRNRGDGCLPVSHVAQGGGIYEEALHWGYHSTGSASLTGAGSNGWALSSGNWIAEDGWTHAGVACDGLLLEYTAQPSGASFDVYYRAHSGSAPDGTTAGWTKATGSSVSTTDNTLTSGVTNSGRRLSYDFGSFGLWDFMVKASGSGTALIDLGYPTTGNRTSGVRCMGSGHGGYGLTEFLGLAKLTSTTGAPTSGTWTTGQLIMDSAGVVWACTAGGTPGAWASKSATQAAALATSPDLQSIANNYPNAVALARSANDVIDPNGHGPASATQLDQLLAISFAAIRLPYDTASKARPSIMFPFEPYLQNLLPSTWPTTYKTTLRARVETDGDVVWIDEHKALGAYGTGNDLLGIGGFDEDHPGDAGHIALAQAWINTIAMPVQSRGISLPVDGTTAMAADLDHGGYRAKNMADATAATDGLNRETGDARYLPVSAPVATTSLQVTTAHGGRLVVTEFFNLPAWGLYANGTDAQATLAAVNEVITAGPGASTTPTAPVFLSQYTVPLTGLATQAADTVLVNATNGSATPTALAMAASTILARLASGDIVAATTAQIKTLLAIATGDVSGLGSLATLSTVSTQFGTTGTITCASGGRISWGELAGVPYWAIYNNGTDAQPSSFQNGPVETAGPGGSTSPTAAYFMGQYSADKMATALADIAMGSHKFTGLSAPSASGHSARWDGLPKILFTHTSDGGVGADTTEDTLYTDTLAASQFATNGDMVQATYAGTFDSGTTGTKRLRAYVAGTVVFDTTALTPTAAGSWQLDVTVVRISSTALNVSVTFNATGFSAANIATVAATFTKLTGLTLTNTQIMKVTGQNGTTATANRIVASMGEIQYTPAAL